MRAETESNIQYSLQADILGGLLVSAELNLTEFAKLVEQVEAAQIRWKTALQPVWAQIQRFAAQSLAPTPEMLHTAILGANEGHLTGGRAWLAELYERVPTSAHARHALRQLVEIRERAELENLFRRGIDRVRSQEPLEAVIESVRTELSGNGFMRPSPAGWRADELMKHEFPPPVWIVPDSLPTGITLFAGKPKIGKSWLALQIAHAVSVGGFAVGHPVEANPVLYLALEDTPRRLQNRMRIILNSTENRQVSDQLHFFTRWSRMNEGGGAELRNWMEQNPETKLIVIDTLAKIRPAAQRNEQLYAADYASMDFLQSLVQDYEIGILVLHHTRKAAAEDILDTISGTTGLTGAVDSIWILERNRQEESGRLFITGRDITESDYAIRFDAEFCTWEIQGERKAVQRSEERKRVLQVLAESPQPLSGQEIALLLETNRLAINQTLSRAVRDGDCERIARGQYQLTEQGRAVIGVNDRLTNNTMLLSSCHQPFLGSNSGDSELDFEDL